MTPQEHIAAAQEIADLADRRIPDADYASWIQLGQLHAMLANAKLQGGRARNDHQREAP